jgi:hypothetical protein
VFLEAAAACALKFKVVDDECRGSQPAFDCNHSDCGVGEVDQVDLIESGDEGPSQVFVVVVDGGGLGCCETSNAVVHKRLQLLVVVMCTFEWAVHLSSGSSTKAQAHLTQRQVSRTHANWVERFCNSRWTTGRG